MSAAPDSKLADLQRANDDLRRQLAERTTERDEGLAREAATAEVLQVINSSSGNLAPVFDAILVKAHTLCGVAYGALLLREGEDFRVAAAHGDTRYLEIRKRQDRFRPPEGTPLWRVLQGEPFVHLVDATTAECYRTAPEYARVIDAGGARTLLQLPLRKDGKLLGAITAFRREVHPFSDKEIALLESFAAQAVVAMENARLLTETREALEQQTATAEVLEVINSSPGDLAPVFEAILEKALSLCEAALGSMVRFDGDAFHWVAARGVPEAWFAEFTTAVGYRPIPGLALYRFLHSGENIEHVADIAADASSRSDIPDRRRFAELSGARTAIWVALRKDQALLGAFVIYRREVRPFSQKQIALLQNFAAQAVIAMENARLLTETREAMEQQTATAEVLQVINSSPGDLAPVFDAILDKAHSLCRVEYGALQLSDGEKFRAVAIRGYPETFEHLLRHPHSLEGPLRALLNGAHLVEIPDVIAHQAEMPNPRAEAAIAVGIRSALFLPLRRENQLLGLISAGRTGTGPFLRNEITLLQNFAAQAVVAMENARLLTETREALEQQTATAEVLQVINSSPGDLAPVFDAILEKAHTLCGAENGTLLTYDGERFWPTAWHLLSAQLGDARLESVDPNVAPSFGRIVRGEPFDHIHDMAEFAAQLSDVATRRRLTAIVEAEGIRTQLVVALRKDDLLLGAITANRKEVRPFTDKQISLLQNFAAQAVIAMENARLITETREALEQQTATAEVLQVINSSPGDLAPVFDAMLDKALDLSGAAFGNLWTFDGKRFRAAALRRVPETYIDILSAETVRPRPGTVLGQIAAGNAFAQIADAALEDAYMSTDARTLVELGGGRTVVGVPLRKETSLLGAITIFRQEVKPFTRQQIEVLQNFAAQAVIAIENARLLTETREALEQQTATAEVLQVINSSPGDLTPVFDAILERAHNLCGVECGALQLYDGETFSAAATRGLPEAFVELLRGGYSPLPGSPSEPLVRGEQCVHIVDMAALVAGSTPAVAHRFQTSIDLAGTRTLLLVPLRKDNELLGFIGAYRKEVRPFTDKQIALLQNFAQQAVIAMENARLLGELRQRTDEVSELNRGLEARVAAQVDELGRVGRLKRFLAPQLAEMIIAKGEEGVLESHRREIVVVFCDLRGYTAFTETAEPEDVLDFLREYHGALGPLVSQFEGTLDQFSGDGIMVFFNDPVPCPDPAERAVKMAIAMREAASELVDAWRRRLGSDLGFGVGIAQGYATLGQIGFSERSGYTAIGTVCNLAARLCAEAKDGQILVSSRVAGAVEAIAKLEDLGDVVLKGLSRPVAAFNVTEPVSGASAEA